MSEKPLVLVVALAAGCASAGLPAVVDSFDVKAASGSPVITRIRDAGTALVPRTGPLDGITDGIAGPGELLVVEGRGFGRQPTILVGGRPAELLARTDGGGAIVRVPRGAATGLVDVTVTTSAGAARLATPLRRLAVVLAADKLRFVAVGQELSAVPGEVSVPGAREVRVDGSGAVAFVLSDAGRASTLSVVDLGRRTPALLGGLALSHHGVALAVAQLAPRLVIVGDGKLSMVDTTSVRRPVLYDALALPPEAKNVRAAELSPDGRVLALLVDGNKVVAFDVANPGAAQLISSVDVLPGERQSLAQKLAFAPDGQTLWVVSGGSAETYPQPIPTRITAVRLLAAYADGEPTQAPPTGPIRRMLAVWKTQTIAGTGAPVALVVGHPPEAGGSAIRDTPEVATIFVTTASAPLYELKNGTVDLPRAKKALSVDAGTVSRGQLSSPGGPVVTTRDLLGAFATPPEGGRVVALALRLQGEDLVLGVESVALDQKAVLFAPVGRVAPKDVRPPFSVGDLALQP